MFSFALEIHLVISTHHALYIASNTNATLFAFLVLRALVALYLDVTSAPINKYLYVFPFPLKTLLRLCCSLSNQNYAAH